MPSAPFPDPAVRRRAVLWLILGTAAWGLSFPIQKMLFLLQGRDVPGADSWFLAGWTIAARSALAAVLMVVLRPSLCRGITGSEWRQGLLLGLFGGLGIMVQADGLAWTDASTSAFLTQAYCILLPLWHCFSRRRAPRPVLLVATGLVLWGIVILSGFNWQRFHMGRGELETLIAALLFTVQIILLELPRYEKNRPLPVTVIMFGGFVLCAAPVGIWNAPSAGALLTVFSTPAEWGLIFVLAAACSGFAYFVMNAFQPQVTATEAGLIYCMEPVFTAGYALFLPGLLAVATGVAYANETLTTTLLAGGGLITLANFLLQLRPPIRKLPD